MYNKTSSYRIGIRASESNNHAVTSESTVLRSLFELRKSYNGPNTNPQQEKYDDAANLAFRNCFWSPRIFQSLRKILVRDGRRFASIKFFDCDVQGDPNSSKVFADILEMILDNNSTASLVIKGGRLIGNNPRGLSSSAIQRLPCGSVPATTMSDRSSTITKALRGGMVTNTSLKSLKLCGLDFSTNNNISNDDENSQNGCFQCLFRNTTLLHLDLSGSDLSSSAQELSDALSGNLSLESLNLRETSLDDLSLTQLLCSVTRHPSITTLNLSRNYLGARKGNNASSSTAGLDAVSKLLESKTSKLESLDLSRQYLQQPTREWHTPAAVSLDNSEQQIQEHKAAFRRALGALSTNKSLRKIDLSGNFGCLVDQSSVEALAACLKTNNTLEYANVSSCGLTSGSIAQLATECFPKCGASLRSLILFGGETVTTIIPTAPLDGCPSTRTNAKNPMAYHNNCCDSATVAALESGLQSNATLENLGELPAQYGRLENILNSNMGGRRAFRMEESLPRGAWCHLLARAEKLDYEYNPCIDHEVVQSSPAASVVFGLLRQGPILFEH